MAARSEWFLSPSPVSNIQLLDAEQESSLNQYYILREESMANRTGADFPFVLLQEVHALLPTFGNPCPESLAQLLTNKTL
jgi:hypothetical protein